MKNADALIRHANLVALKKSSTELAALTATTSAYWSDMLRGKKSFGEKAARKLEEALGLARGSMDEPGLAPKKLTAGREEYQSVQNITRDSENEMPADILLTEDVVHTIHQLIPTDMPFSNNNITRTIHLLSNIIRALPMTKRLALREEMQPLLEFPEAWELVARNAVKALGTPDTITSDLQLGKWLAGDPSFAVETRPMELQPKRGAKY